MCCCIKATHPQHRMCSKAYQRLICVFGVRNELRDDIGCEAEVIVGIVWNAWRHFPVYSSTCLCTKGKECGLLIYTSLPFKLWGVAPPLLLHDPHHRNGCLFLWRRWDNNSREIALGYLFCCVSRLAGRQGSWRLVARFFDFFVFVPVVRFVLLFKHSLYQEPFDAASESEGGVGEVS